jgi:hypothetical protein
MLIPSSLKRANPTLTLSGRPGEWSSAQPPLLARWLTGTHG